MCKTSVEYKLINYLFIIMYVPDFYITHYLNINKINVKVLYYNNMLNF